MQPVPYYDIIKEQGKLTQTQLTILVTLQYIFFVLYLCELTIALNNTWQFLIKQNKYKTWPLLWFYLLTMWLSLSEAYSSIFMFYILDQEEIYGLAMRPMIKLNMGVIQCWMLVELALRITDDLR